MDEREFTHQVAAAVGADERRAEGLTLAVFQELHDRLPVKEAADVASQLPTGLKRLWGDAGPVGRRVRKVHQAEFVGDVRQRAGLPSDGEAERAIRAVFASLQRLLGSPTGKEGEAWDIFSVLPKDLKMLWLAAQQAGEPRLS